MISEGTIKKCKRQLRSGVPEGEIRQQLLQSGYSDEDIGKVFEPRAYDMRSWYLVFAIILLLVGLYIFLSSTNLLVLILSCLLFVQYYREVNRLKKQKSADTKL